MIELFELAGRDSALRFSPYCWRIRFALAHKGLEARLVPWRFHQKSRLPGAPKNTKVPILVDGGTIIAESAEIAAYLEDNYPNGPSLFGGPAGEAHGRFIAAWADTIVIPALGPAIAPFVLPLLHASDKDYFRTAREARFGASFEALRDAAPQRIDAARAILAPLRTVLAQQDFLGGDEPGYPDYAVFSVFQWARCVGAPPIILAEDPLAPWQEAMLDLFGGLARDTPTAPPP